MPPGKFVYHPQFQPAPDFICLIRPSRNIGSLTLNETSVRAALLAGAARTSRAHQPRCANTSDVAPFPGCMAACDMPVRSCPRSPLTRPAGGHRATRINRNVTLGGPFASPRTRPGSLVIVRFLCIPTIQVIERFSARGQALNARRCAPREGEPSLHFRFAFLVSEWSRGSAYDPAAIAPASPSRRLCSCLTPSVGTVPPAHDD